SPMGNVKSVSNIEFSKPSLPSSINLIKIAPPEVWCVEVLNLNSYLSFLIATDDRSPKLSGGVGENLGGTNLRTNSRSPATGSAASSLSTKLLGTWLVVGPKKMVGESQPGVENELGLKKSKESLNFINTFSGPFQNGARPMSAICFWRLCASATALSA